VGSNAKDLRGIRGKQSLPSRISGLRYSCGASVYRKFGPGRKKGCDGISEKYKAGEMGGAGKNTPVRMGDEEGRGTGAKSVETSTKS